MYVYLDETGNLTKGRGNYFIVATFTVGDPKRIENAFRSWQRSKFPKKLQKQAEVKFNDSHVLEELRIKTITFLVKQDIRIFHTFLNIKNIPQQFRKSKDAIRTGLLYTEIVAKTLELYLPLTELEFRIARDRRILKGVTLSEFNDHLSARLTLQFPAKTHLQIEAVDSTASTQIQVADWVCGALGRYYEKKKNGEVFYQKLKNNIVKSEELFSDHWTKVWEK